MNLLAPFLLISAMAAFGSETLVLQGTVSLPGVTGRFDHFAVDTNSHRVFVAALGNNTLEIIDASAAKRLHSITGLRKPTGVAFLPGQNQIVVANGADGTVRVFDGTTYKLIKIVSGLDDADNVRFDVKANRIYVGYGDGALAGIDTGKWQIVSTMELKAHPESFQLEQNGSRIFVNVPDGKQIAIVDRNTRATIATAPMDKYQANFPMASDESHHLLFIGCRSPARLVVLDTIAYKPITDLAISGDTDDLFYDVARKRLYISCGEGFIDTIEQSTPDTYKRISRLPTALGARTSFFSPDMDRLFLAVPARGSQHAEIRIYIPQ